MTMHVHQLVGVLVTDSDGVAVGTVEEVFRDDVDGVPSWARIRSAKGLYFVPLTGCKMTRTGGLCIPFDSRRILGEPNIRVDRHMSVDQEEQLCRYFGIRVPAQRGARTQAQAQAGWTQAQAGRAQAGQAQARWAQGQHDEAGGEWMIRSEERISVNLETRESGRVRVHKYVVSSQVRQTVRVFREELEVERIPVSDDDQVTGDMAESEQEIILHEARASITKETVPVERVRLSVRKVEEDKTVDYEIRKERIEIVDDG